MSTSEVSMCNMALSRVGGRPIASLTEESTEALHCRTFYDQVRDETLRAHRWSFATRREALAELGDAPTGWAYRYAAPVDCLLAREIVRPHTSMPAIRYRLENDVTAGRVLLTDQPQATLLYTARITDPALFDVSFVGALTWALAAAVALPIGATETMQRNAQQMAAYMLGLAQASDAAEDGVMVIDHEPDWIAARGAGRCDWQGWR